MAAHVSSFTAFCKSSAAPHVGTVLLSDIPSHHGGDMIKLVLFLFVQDNFISIDHFLSSVGN